MNRSGHRQILFNHLAADAQVTVDTDFVFVPELLGEETNVSHTLCIDVDAMARVIVGDVCLCPF